MMQSEPNFNGYRVLTVDDNAANLAVITGYLENCGFDVLVATDGEKGILRAEFARPDIILLDVMMPGIDGFETCRRLKADEKTEDIPVIFMTALTSTEDKIKGFEAGGVDYITKPIQHEEMLARIKTHLRIRYLTRKLQEQNKEIMALNERLKDENIRISAEMEIARRIQTSLLPGRSDNFYPGFDIAASMLPAEEVGGDFYDIVEGQSGDLWLGIGDVCGHGVTPGLIMMIAQTAHFTLIRHMDRMPGDVLTLLNDILYRDVHERLGADLFMTFTTLKYLGAGVFQHAGAHLPLIGYRQATGRCDTFETKGGWLNVIPNIADASIEASFTLAVGDILILYTDGITEACNREGCLLEPAGLIKLVQRHAARPIQDMCNAILQDVLAWCDNQQKDDMSLVVARRIK